MFNLVMRRPLFITLIIFIVFIICSSLTADKNTYISFEYAGNADKPMAVVYLIKKPLIDSEWNRTIEYSGSVYNFAVNTQDYLFMKKLVYSSQKKVFKESDYNGFKITIQEKDTLISYWITRKESNSFFDRLIAYLKANKRSKDLIWRFVIYKSSNVY